ncbi:DUF434 domain-containing protein [Methanobacterium sp. BAmetb5]|uniref:DUF434 domain-containing protein n=1 Tax=Methanobacterium sp. BAmetb5 TaxID=2025351 RepID=UPI000E9353AD|nr:DUF434 domain-containing protein [Methanobacterium sp. BAmetb5]AXV40796.1 MAG: hypothetical protein CIT02_10975 [Methanobacterium sp. BAmetb5]
MNFQDPILTEAKKDFQYLLERGFPRTGALEYVGNHYLLGDLERNYLIRTVFPLTKIESRRNKLILLSDIKGKDVLLDGYNVLITVEALIRGEEVVVKCDDGVIRDVKAVFGKYKKNENTAPALNSIISLLKIFKPQSVLFFFDSPVSLSGELARATREILNSQEVPGDAQTSENVDYQLINLSHEVDGVVATSDGIIIDKVDKVLDVPSYVARLNRNKKVVK